jgi:hypothetical protein
MEKLSIRSAKDLQKYLLEKGYATIEQCIVDEDGAFTITNYALKRKDDPIDHVCFGYATYELTSYEALAVLHQYLNRVKLHPDPINVHTPKIKRK